MKGYMKKFMIPRTAALYKNMRFLISKG